MCAASAYDRLRGGGTLLAPEFREESLCLLSPPLGMMKWLSPDGWFLPCSVGVTLLGGTCGATVELLCPSFARVVVGEVEGLVFLEVEGLRYLSLSFLSFFPMMVCPEGTKTSTGKLLACKQLRWIQVKLLS